MRFTIIFNRRCCFIAVVAQKSVFRAKTIASLTGNTQEALRHVRLYQKNTEGACRPFKVMTFARSIFSELIVLYVGVYDGT